MRSGTKFRKLLFAAGCWPLFALAVTGQPATTTTLTSNTNPQCENLDVTFTATVTSGATGSVEFLDGVTVIGTSTLSGGTAALTINSLSAGTHSITAHYLGDGTYDPSTSSPPVSQVIWPKPTVIATPSGQTVCSGEIFTQ